MAQILIPPPKQSSKTQIKRSKVVTGGRVISGDEMLRQLKEKEELIKRQIAAKEERLQLKEKRRQEKEKESEEKQIKKQKREEEKRLKEQKRKDEIIKKAVGGRLAAKKFTCGVCGETGRMIDEMNGVKWYGCEENRCERWYHEECLSLQEREYLTESVNDGSEWYCRKCKPWLYDEE
ncbi:chromatin assembly factor 1 subunit A-like [Mercenaria mercenaria]|uniref:chromatin assembly factor 1 subunit A-like n=1 Tax=Mercenaria mercenaria TaxID=6596 RepID=UPI00234E9F6D|nr:chromatin assembly factor 1 subunit A-like [Mercenaria mercenaria]